MKILIHTFAKSTLSTLAMISVLTISTLSTSVQAAPWKTLPGSTCQAWDPGALKPGELTYSSEYVKHTDVAGGSSNTAVYCPIKMDDNAPATIGVFVDYSKSDNMSCWLYSNHWAGYPKVSKYFGSMPTGLKKFVYKTINTGTWWSVQVRCSLGQYDKLHSMNYKAL